MSRAILEAWIPYLIWLLAGCGGIWFCARVSGARPALAKVRRLHRCEGGSVQTLSFVLTLPIFIMLVLLVVQVSQLMIGIAVVQYAAYAAARAAVVWLPAEMPAEPANTLDPEALETSVLYPVWKSRAIHTSQYPPNRVWKYRKIWSAAALAVIPISPSKAYLKENHSNVAETLAALYQAMAPSSARNPRIPTRLRNKAAYAAANTRIEFTGVDRDGLQGPTYNPYPGHYVTQRDPQTGQTTQVWVPWKPNEIGWEDPISLTVRYRFALLPGPGRFLSPGSFLSARLSNPDGTPDRVSHRIQVIGPEQDPNFREKAYTTELRASVTLSSEGLKSAMPYVVLHEIID